MHRHIPDWVYWPIKIVLVLGLMAPIFGWSAHLLSVLPTQHGDVAANSQTDTYGQPTVVAGSDVEVPSTPQPYVNGIDVSHYQGEIHWSKVADSDIAFVYIKATSGETYVDPKFKQNWNQVPSTKLVRGAYHFFLASDDPRVQAEHFINTMGPLKDDDLPPMLDLEVSDHVAVDVLQQRALSWLSIVEKATGRKPIVYTSNGFANEELTDPKFSQYPLWIAEYADTLKGVPSPWKQRGWKIWQHSQSGNVNGITGDVDLDRFRGSLDDLQQFIRESKLIDGE